MRKDWIRLGFAAGVWIAAVWPATGVAELGMDRLMTEQQAKALSGETWTGSAAGKYLAGRLAQREKDYSSAADFLEGALSWDPNNLELRHRVFLLLLAEGRLEAAVQHAHPLERDGVEPLLPIVAQAAAAVKEKDYAAALGYFGRLDNNGVAGLIRLLGQAWAALGTGDMTAVRAALTFGAEQPQWESLIAIHRALIEDIGDGAAEEAYAALTDNHAISGGRASEILANFRARQADSTVEPLIATVQDGLGEVFFSIAIALNRGDQDLSALIYGQLGLEIAPENDLMRLLVAEVIAGQGRYQAAAGMYATVPEPSQLYYDAQIARARNLARADMPDEAVSVLRSLSDAYPDRAEAASVLGDVLRAESRFAEAVTAYDQAVSRLGDITADNWRLLYSRAIALERSGEWDRAEQDLQAALAFDGDQAYVLNYLGYSWIDREENLEQATEMVQRAVELKPQDGFIADSLGWAHYRMGRYAEAVRVLERAVTLEPLDPVINEHLGDAYWRVGRKTEARFQWRRALNLEPEDKQVPLLEEKLRCGLDRCAVAG